MGSVSKATIKFGAGGATGRRSSNERGGEDVICNISSGLLISILHFTRQKYVKLKFSNSCWSTAWEQLIGKSPSRLIAKGMG